MLINKNHIPNDEHDKSIYVNAMFDLLSNIEEREWNKKDTDHDLIKKVQLITKQLESELNE